MRRTIIRWHDEYMIGDTVTHRVHDRSAQQPYMVGTLEGRPLGNFNTRPQDKSMLAQIAQQRRIMVHNTLDLCWPASRQIGQTDVVQCLHCTVTPRNGRAVRVSCWLAQVASDPLFHFFRDDVLQPVRLFVHLVPRVA